MAYQTPPTFSSGAILTAAQLTILSDDLEFLYGLTASGINAPFASLRVTANLTSTNNQWLIRNLHRYLHYKARLLANDNNDLDIFYNGVRVYHDGTARSATYTYSGYVDLNTPSGWSDYIGTWSSVTTYNRHAIVVSSGVYYASKQNSNLNHAVSDTAWWTNLGAAGAFVTANSLYTLYVATNLSASPQFVVDYLLESDQTTI